MDTLRLADALARVRAADAVLRLVSAEADLRARYVGELKAAVADVARCHDRVAAAGARAVLARWTSAR